MKAVFIVHEELGLSLLPGQWLPIFRLLKSQQHEARCLAFVSWREFINIFWRNKMRRRFYDPHHQQNYPLHILLKTTPLLDLCFLALWLCWQRWVVGGQPILAHARGPVASWLALRARDVFGLVSRVVADLRGITPEEWRLANGYGRKNYQAWIERLALFEKEALIKADACIFVTQRLADYMQTKYAAKTRKQLIVPCYIDGEMLPHANIEKGKQAFSDLQRQIGGRLVLLYSGGAAIWQKVDVLLRLAAILRQNGVEVFLLLLSQHRHEWQPLLHAAGLTASDYAFCSLSSREAQYYSRLASFAFLLREKEVVNEVAFPVKFAEYLAAGVPVVISRAVPTCATLLEKYQAGYVLEKLAEEDLHLLAKRLQSVWRQPAYATMQAAALRLVEEELLFRRFGGEILKLYNALIDDKVSMS